ncbi:hypothetical protein EKI60_02090 [Candidatus Saccharibacteria bacterium]|nr:MAG: hypothetical protein EKI60_02090 [Candidatus Saccharibacteria bacterium]
MPVENPDPTSPQLPNEPTELGQPIDEWQQLAREAHEGWDMDHPGVAALYEHHVAPRLQNDSAGQPAPTGEERAGGRFLHKHGSVDSKEVEQVVGYLRSNGETVPDKAGDRTAHYLNFMAEAVNDGILTGDPDSVRRQIDAHVIKTEDVPESYFALQRRIAREQGHGDIEITPDMKRQLIEAAQADQRGSLDKWVEYLGGDDGSYPNWFKRYAWDSVLKLGAYDKEKAKFDRRDNTTVAAYPELNREALAYAYDTVKKFHVLGETVDEPQLTQILKEGSFGRLYAHAIMEVTPDSLESRNEVRGSWTLFNQTTDPRTARRLSGSLQGHGTGWCTAGESTAEAQLQGGDFYVYYTRDEDGKDTIPRVAVRMQAGEVAEVRGVLPSQELEPIMADITSERLQGLPGGERYIQRATDMKRLTALDGKLQKDPNTPLSKEDLLFLYEFDRNIEGFGYDRDPRIAEIRSKRGERDLPEIAAMLPEVLASQGAASYSAYYEIAGATGAEAISELQFRHLLETQMTEWSTNGVMDYVVRDFIESGNKPNLLATPNVTASWQTLRAMATKFGESQPYETYIYEELYSQYTAEELSGQPTGGALRFSIMPSGDTKQLGYAPVNDQLTALRRMQADQPRLNARVPSVLDALTFWQTLRARGDALVGSGVFEKTIIRHFDLAAKRLGGWSDVPYSFVLDDGRPASALRLPRMTTMLASWWGKNFIFAPSSFSFSF